MSLDATMWAWKKTMKPHLKLVLLSLADRADSNFECFPKISTLATDTCQSERSVKRQLEELESLGCIADTGKRKGRTNKTKVWQLNGVNGRINSDTESSLNSDTESPLKVKRGHTVTFKGDTQSPSNGDTQSPSYIEPPIEESLRGTYTFPDEESSRHEIAKAPSQKATKQPADSTQVFEAYCEGMKQRYGDVTPQRNAAINSQLKKMIERIGLENSITVARHYPLHQSGWYVQKVHSVGLMLADCEALLIQVQSGKMITRSGAYKADRQGEFQNSIAQVTKQDMEVF